MRQLAPAGEHSKLIVLGAMAGVSRLKAGTAEKLSEAVASNVADIDMWAAHTHQVVALLLQIQRAGEEKEKAWAHERAATAAATLAAARGAKLENALHAGIVAAEGRGVNATFRSWVVAVRSMREAEAQARRERSEQRAERLASAGRGEMLEEHSRLLKDAAQAGRTVQEMKAKLHERSQESSLTLTLTQTPTPTLALALALALALSLTRSRSSSARCCATR